jgi:hypothetical protein
MTIKRKNRPYKNSVAERIRRMFAQGIEIDDIAKRTGSTREYVMTVTYKLRVTAEQKVNSEAEITEALAALWPPESEPKPEVTEVNTLKTNYHKDRVSRTNERINENLVLLHTHFKNPARVHSTWRYEYRSPVTNGKRSRFLGTSQNMTPTQARNLVARYNKIIQNGFDPFPIGARAVGWVNARKNAVLIDAPVADAPPIVVPLAVAERVEVAEPAFIPSFLKDDPIFKNEQEYLASKGDRQVIKPVPPEISEPVKARVKRVVKPKPLPKPNPTMWGRVKAKLRGWLA